MLRFNRIARSLVVPVAAFALAGTASTSAFAWPHFFSHRHPGVLQADTRITVNLFNSNSVARQVKINDRIYTMQPHQALTIKAPAGTNVYAENSGRLHQKGEVLFPVIAQLQDKTLLLNAVN
jgi:DNA-binding beta-propeller fold protein YncE